jgi:RNA polymerase sigma-70 factor (ECF subfamily)
VAESPSTPPARDATGEQARAALVRLVRDEGARVLATLTRTVGSLQVAQDAVQDATVRALETWPRDGVPDNPRAWLTVTARRRAIDVIRRENRRLGKEVAAMDVIGPWEDDDVAADQSARSWAHPAVDDDLLRLVFTCCHPALALETQVALSLRTVCGLSTAEVARALLVPEATMLKRLTRAKQKIAQARIPYRIPAAHELPGRVAGVAACIYLVFNEGYSATSGDDVLRGELVDEAVRLGRLVHALMPDEPALTGLLALMLLQDSRRAARCDADGDVVLLADQDRSLWRRDLVVEGVTLIGEALRRTPDRPDPYVVQASLAACHALAPSYEQTDWAAVTSWYDVLLTVHDTPVVRLNRAVAIGERDGDAAGLAAVEAVAGLDGYAPWHATHAELLHRLGRGREARTAWSRALDLETNAATRRFLQRRLSGTRP